MGAVACVDIKYRLCCNLRQQRDDSVIAVDLRMPEVLHPHPGDHHPNPDHNKRQEQK